MAACETKKWECQTKMADIMVAQVGKENVVQKTIKIAYQLSPLYILIYTPIIHKYLNT